MLQAERDGSIKSIVLISAKPGSFVAGADVGMLSKAKNPVEGASISKYVILFVSSAYESFFLSSEEPRISLLSWSSLGTHSSSDNG